MGKFIIKHLVGTAFLGIVSFIGVLFVALLFLLLRKIKDYYEEKSLYRCNHGKKRERRMMAANSSESAGVVGTPINMER